MLEAKRVPALDGVRGLAILLVILGHTGVLTTTGWVGVDLFFVLSGYLITGILVRARARPRYFRTFWARRVLRIAPPYVAYLVLILWLVPLWTHQGNAQPWVYWLYLTNVWVARGGWVGVPHLLQHLWSVAVEEQFYLFWPFVVAFVEPKRLRAVCGAGIVVAIALRVLSVLLSPGSTAPYVLAPMRMDALLVGAWLALGPPPSRLWPATVAGTAAMTLVLVEGGETMWVYTAGFFLLAVASAGLLSASLSVPVLTRVFSIRWLRAAGRYSYTAYLIHPILLVALLRIGLTAVVPVTVATLCLTFGLAWASWRLYEAPILSLNRFFPAPGPVETLPSMSAYRPASRG